MNDHDQAPVVIADPIAHKFRNEFKVDPEMVEILARYWALASAAGETAVYRTPRHADPFFELFPSRMGPRGPELVGPPVAAPLLLGRHQRGDILRGSSMLSSMPRSRLFLGSGARRRPAPPPPPRPLWSEPVWRFLDPALLRLSTPAPVVATTALTASSPSGSWHRLERRPRR